PKGVLRLECTEGGYYPVDVAKWTKTVIRSEDPEEPDEIIWSILLTDATVKCRVTYANPGSGMATYPEARAAHLDRYTITWRAADPTVSLPKTDGVLDVLVESDVEARTSKEFTLLVMPAATKDTAAALVSLRATPEDFVYFNGMLSAKGTLKVTGKDVVTGEELTAEASINAVFADYYDPNSAH
ncbi:MAG: hypothetical protein ABIK62_03730, partial [candidate division WOR-3 bacterium]